MVDSAICRVVVLISGNGSNLQAIIDQAKHTDCPYRVVAVISNRPAAFGLQRAADAKIPTAVINHQDYPDRVAFDQALQNCIEQYTPDLVVLAGFMRILTPELVAHYQGRLLNIHPSLLPKYRGLHTHARVLANGDSEHGASVHFVTAELDGGPVIIQARIPVLADDSEISLAKRLLQREQQIYPQVIRWYAEQRLRLSGKQIFFDQQILNEPLQNSIA